MCMIYYSPHNKKIYYQHALLCDCMHWQGTPRNSSMLSIKSITKINCLFMTFIDMLLFKVASTIYHWGSSWQIVILFNMHLQIYVSLSMWVLGSSMETVWESDKMNVKLGWCAHVWTYHFHVDFGIHILKLKLLRSCEMNVGPEELCGGGKPWIE